MKVIKSEDKLTSKFLHDNGNESSIKLEHSGEFDTELNLEQQDNNKYSMVLSCSKGCIMSCSFCFLTQKKAEHSNISAASLLNNMKEALLYQVRENPEMVNRYIKLCWMGMGEPMLHTIKIYDVTMQFLDWVFENNLAKGLDGVDLSTVLPNISARIWKKNLTWLAEDLTKYEINPLRKEKSIFRIFYSLHSANQVTRDEIIPNGMQIDKALYQLSEFADNNGIDLVLHCMFMEGVNDKPEDLTELNVLLQEHGLQDKELRILRFNSPNGNLKESNNLVQVLDRVQEWDTNLKIQYSSGSEVQAACGMFVVV